MLVGTMEEACLSGPWKKRACRDHGRSVLVGTMEEACLWDHGRSVLVGPWKKRACRGPATITRLPSLLINTGT